VFSALLQMRNSTSYAQLVTPHRNVYLLLHKLTPLYLPLGIFLFFLEMHVAVLLCPEPVLLFRLYQTKLDHRSYVTVRNPKIK
jgi:hypothetical protein